MQVSITRKLGWKTLEHLNLSLLKVMTWLLAASGGGRLLLKILGEIAQLHVDVTDDLPLGNGVERESPSGEDLHEVVGELVASQVESDPGFGKGVTLVDGDAVGDTFTGAKAGGVQGEHGLDGVDGRQVDFFNMNWGPILHSSN